MCYISFLPFLILHHIYFLKILFTRIRINYYYYIVIIIITIIITITFKFIVICIVFVVADYNLYHLSSLIPLVVRNLRTDY